MTSTGYQPEPTWQFPPTLRSTSINPDGSSDVQMPGAFHDAPQAPKNEPSHPTPNPSTQPTPNTSSRPRRTHWPPRTCRICLETVQPTFHAPSTAIPDVLQPTPSVTYDSPDPESGRLLRPCTCKGSSKYVHEGCLQSWRHADPGYGQRNYWQCPTCGFKYRLERMQWGRWISSTATQLVLTVVIFVTALFVMGFVADPIINLYTDPYGVLTNPSKVGAKLEAILTEEEGVTWTEHFVKGLAATGLLGFVKVLVALGPWQYWIRGGGIMGGGRSGNTGRDRMASISWIVVVIGVVTFLLAVYKGVRSWSRRTLEKAGERVMDVAGDDDDDGDDDDEGSTRDPGESSSSGHSGI